MEERLVHYATLIISSLTILSYFLSIYEYYNNKAYWDYFHIDDRLRTNMRSGFHAEYLSYALIFTCLLLVIDGALVFFNNKIADKDLFKLYYSLICIAIFVIASGVLYCIIKKFQSQDVNERRLWPDEKSYGSYLNKVFMLNLLKLGVPYGIIMPAIYLFSIGKKYLIAAILLAASFIYLQFMNYSERQQLIGYMKYFNIYKPTSNSDSDKDKNMYVVLAQIGNTVQMNKCTINHGVLSINLDEVKILTTDSLDYRTMYFDKFIKICNGANCTKHYIVGYRDDFERQKMFPTKKKAVRKVNSKKHPSKG